MNQPVRPFLETLYHLRTSEHIILYNKLTAIPHQEEQEVIAFLAEEYEKESLDYPFSPPPFSPVAALWAAKTVYFAAQLFLYRENKPEELHSILPPYVGSIDASVILSADLYLRFLPSVKYALEALDVNDPLIPLLEQYLKQFPYSAIDHDVDFSDSDTETIIDNNCLRQLYLDRITDRKAEKWAKQPLIKNAILANLGNHKNNLWRELNN